MTTFYQRGEFYFVGVPVHPTGMIKRATGTRLKGIAASMAKMMDELGPHGRRAWEFLDAVRDNRLTVGLLHDAWLGGKEKLDALAAELRDTDIQPFIPAWLKYLDDHVAIDTAQHYFTHVRSFIPAGERFPVSRLTRVALTQWLNSRECTSSTKRKYHASMSSLCNYLVENGVLLGNPMVQVKRPKPGKSRMSILNHSQVMQLVNAQHEPFRTISAIMHATGMEISTVLQLTRGDIDTETWMVRAKGTKTKSRDRLAYVMEWARPFVIAHIRTLLPGAKLFPGITRWAPAKSHRKTREILGIADYTLRDSRHTFSVDAAKAGVTPEKVARQLGHASTQMVNNVYSRYNPSYAEMAKEFEKADQRILAVGEE